MLIAKTQPAGIDFPIQQLQTKLHDGLIRDWGLADSNQYQAYGRCYRNRKEAGYIAEVYTAANNYQEVYWDDTLTAISFFGITGSLKKEITTEANIHFVMFADLEKLALRNEAGAVITHRSDEELRLSVLQLIGKSSFGFTVEGVELWIENVLREYPGSRREDRMKAVDMHPVHCFRINMTLRYTNKRC
jgi:hypothetical protein